MQNKQIRFLDLFAGCGGLSEGFIQARYEPVAHVEVDQAACYSLKTRMCYHWLSSHNKLNIYNDYLNGKISRAKLYESVPEELIASVINKEISNENLDSIFSDIDNQLQDYQLDLIIGGPPCQAYSLVGRSRDKNNMKNDKRNYLYKYYAEFLKKYNPKYFVFENVTGILSAKDNKGIRYFDTMLSLFNEIGYECQYQVLNAKDYGVPQVRKRVIIIGKQKQLNITFPVLEISPINIKIKDLFADLPKIKAGEECRGEYNKTSSSLEYLYNLGIKKDGISLTFHTARPNKKQDLEIYKIAANKWNKNQERLNYNDLPDKLKTHRNRKSFTDRFKVVAGDLEASHTVVAHIAKDGHYYIHPDINQNRSITPREAARLQTFPDDYYFESIKELIGRTAAFKQIGNAVPVLLARRIAEKLKEKW